MDKYDSQGNWLNGTLYLRGRVRMSGVVRFEPSDGGEIFFYPDRPLSTPSVPLEPYLRSFVLAPKGKPSAFNVDSSVRQILCAEAKATLEFDGLQIEVAHGAEHEGAYPTNARAISVGSYSKCAER